MINKIPTLDKRGLRSFGLTTGSIVAVLFGIVFPYLFGASWPTWPWIVLAVLGIWALVAPKSLNHVYLAWMHLGQLIGKVTTPVVLTLVFFITIFPGALLMRLFRNDPMRREYDDSESYRVDSKQPSVKNLERPY